MPHTSPPAGFAGQPGGLSAHHGAIPERVVPAASFHTIVLPTEQPAILVVENTVVAAGIPGPLEEQLTNAIDVKVQAGDDGAIHPCTYQETGSYQITRLFINDRERVLRELLADSE